MSRDLDWRDQAASQLAAGTFARLRVRGSGRALVVDDPRFEAVEALTEVGFTVDRWNRFATPRLSAQEWPGDGPYELVAIRLNKSKEVLDLALHAALGRMSPNGSAFLYGANDEGIRSAPKRLAELTGKWTTRATGGHCRLMEWRSPTPAVEGFRVELEDWRIEATDGGTTWPGVFGTERVDAGTALLLRHLPEPEGRILDFGAGRGVIARALVQAGAEASTLTLLEPDALAAKAAGLNVPGAEVLTRMGWPIGRSWNLVISNPPYHEGKAESLGPIEELISGAAEDLESGGELRIVVQRRLPIEPLLNAGFGGCTVVVDEGPYRVWSATRK